jgi:GNAT superfamily N-acetyltransferase
MHRLRSHTMGDAEAIGRILAAGWQQAYGGFLTPAAMGQRNDPLARHTEIAEFLRDEFDPEVEGLIVAEDRAVDGFVHMVLEDKAEMGAAGHVNLLYVDPAAQGQGLGRLLMRAAANWFADRVSGPIVLSAFARNPYRGFYDRIGGEVAKTRSFELEGQALESVIYRWESPQALLREGDRRRPS